MFVYSGLRAMQHRGTGYSGMVSFGPDRQVYRKVGRGVVQEVFDTKTLAIDLPCQNVLGHNRYATVEDKEGGSISDNAHPIVGSWHGIPVAIAHNGNLTNVTDLKNALPVDSCVTSIDTELILRRFCLTFTDDPVVAIKQALDGVRGTYSLCLLLPDMMIAVRDPSGNRPLSIGLRDDGSICIASETSAYESVDAEYVRDIAPGEIVIIRDGGMSVDYLSTLSSKRYAYCVFEQIYFSAPGSVVFGESVARFRVRLGEALEKHCPALTGTIVVPVPDSANFIAQGYALNGRSGKLQTAILRNHYIGRSFIEPTPELREDRIRHKFQSIPGLIKGQNIVLIDDSVVRLSTLPHVVSLLRKAGAKEVHCRIAAPLIVGSCHYGIDTPTLDELAANRMGVEDMRKVVEADSIEFLTLDVLRGLNQEGEFCYACMDGKYPPSMEPAEL